MIFLTNSLTRKKEKFEPLKENYVGIYSCGPTVYWNQHVGHMYAYVAWDTLVRFLRYSGFQVKWVMNLTDVGHMTSDEDLGEDKMEKGAKREGISVWDLAEKYITQFKESLDLLNVKSPDVLTKATDNIPEQIDLIKRIEANGFTYKTPMGVVFDTEKFEEYTKFGNLKLDQMQKRDDVEVDPDKKNPWDFFLWVTGNPKHVMKWDSPWGEGYPGWHIECTAMSTKFLGPKFDIHTGGIEHISVHHTNEIAQGFAAFGRQTANYWLHNAHLLGEGGVKMSKSLGNFVTVQELVEQGHDPLALRYLFMTSHYKKGLSFSEEALKGAENALDRLRNHVSEMKSKSESQEIKDSDKTEALKIKSDFDKALEDDLNTPQALAVVWDLAKSDISSKGKLELLKSFDEVLGLNLFEQNVIEIPTEIQKLAEKREALRKESKFEEADDVRKQIEDKGFKVEDSEKGSKITKA